MLVRSLLSAGVDTTIDSIGLALRCLIDHPGQWRLLREMTRPWPAPRSRRRRATIPPAKACSAQRSHAPSSSPARQSAKHEKVLVLVGSAGRDPARWDDPDRFDIRRKLTGQIGYGAGIHGCVAQMMAQAGGRGVLPVELGDEGQNAGLRGAVGACGSIPGLRGLSTIADHG